MEKKFITAQELLEDSFKVDKVIALKSDDLESLKNSYIGRKGKIALLFKELSRISDKERKKMKYNDIRKTG